MEKMDLSFFERIIFSDHSFVICKFKIFLVGDHTYFYNKRDKRTLRKTDNRKYTYKINSNYLRSWLCGSIQSNQLIVGNEKFVIRFSK